jgi:hypothetical protein
MSATFAEYSDEYKEKCKIAWYSAGRPAQFEKIHSIVPKDDRGRKPKITTLRQWKKDMMWDFWGDEMDSKALTIVEDDIIHKKAEMLKRHAEMAHNLQLQGMSYLKEEGFDSSSSAVGAIIKGAELERISRGIGEMMVKMAQMTDSELKDEIMSQINRASESGQIIDSEIVPEKDEEEQTKE